MSAGRLAGSHWDVLGTQILCRAAGSAVLLTRPTAKPLQGLSGGTRDQMLHDASMSGSPGCRPVCRSSAPKAPMEVWSHQRGRMGILYQASSSECHLEGFKVLSTA